jgi:hypothetical protein
MITTGMKEQSGKIFIMKYILFGILAIFFFAVIVPKIFNLVNAWLAFGVAIAGIVGIYYYIKHQIEKHL